MGHDIPQLREKLKHALDDIVKSVNGYLAGGDKEHVIPLVKTKTWQKNVRLWLEEISEKGKSSNTNSKSLGTYLEKLVKAEISHVLGIDIGGSSGKGVDIPELKIGIKVTSDKNPQSSDRFESAYQRILGSDDDLVIFVYNGKDIKNGKRLELLWGQYMRSTEVADSVLCKTALLLQKVASKEGDAVVDATTLKRCLKVIAHTNKQGGGSSQPAYFRKLEEALRKEHAQEICEAVEAGETAILKRLVAPPPSNVEWDKFLASPLDGKIAISFALQWRYKFPNRKFGLT